MMNIQNSLVRRGASSSSSLVKLSGGGMSPLSLVAISLATLLVLVAPLCHSAPAVLQQATADQRQLLSQMDTACSSFFSADLRFALSEVSDVLGEICILMLVQKSKELKGRGNNKTAELEGPAGIQSRGYFLYRPRNGRRDLEYK
uniref:neuromedin-U isoform X2 n=1 Tax=Doryrhamphus excisus TaxID=161450 RepID=UPI0025ADD850|nr:neuromedin-U isoform X2 [Doryrhamphus excisus]